MYKLIPNRHKKTIINTTVLPWFFVNNTAIQNEEKENVSNKVEARISYLLTYYFYLNDQENLSLASDCSKGVKKNQNKKIQQVEATGR